MHVRVRADPPAEQELALYARWLYAALELFGMVKWHDAGMSASSAARRRHDGRMSLHVRFERHRVSG
jgi:hypothetical protein